MEEEIDIDLGELALAHCGVSELINGYPARFGKGRIQEALDIVKELPKLAKQLVSGELRYKPVKRHGSYRKLLDRLAKPMSPQEIEGLAKLFPPEATDMSGPFVLVAQEAWARLADMFPVSVIESFTGPTNITPTADAVWKFFNQLQVLDDPRRVYELMGSGALLRTQVEAVRSIYPTLSALIDTSIYEAIANAKAAKASYQLPARVDVGVKAWLGRRQVDFRPPALPGDAPPEPTPGRRTHTDFMAKADQTRTQAAVSNT